MTPAQNTDRKSKPYLKPLVLATVVTAVVYGYTQYGDTLTLDHLAQRETQLRDYQQQHPVLIYGLAFGVYVAVTGLSLPGATVLTLVYAWYFGLIRGIVLVSFASTTGATLAFLLSRYLLRETIQHRFGEKLAAFNRNLETEGAFYLFTLRLIPAVPFFVINVVMGLTPMKTRTFWWVSQVGMFAGTTVFVYAGSSVPDLTTLAEKGASGILNPQLMTAFVVLGLFPLFVKKLLARLKPAAVNADLSNDI
ncbi:MAG: TVP38/TMEM64 family protein [Fuerstiella sp.]|nr:TVP38/TMEM64 family protein [Fuerstiella sp.]MCP4856412.1 TVP38/TMEM64 family protein [Fuerstiella sp.]